MTAVESPNSSRPLIASSGPSSRQDNCPQGDLDQVRHRRDQRDDHHDADAPPESQLAVVLVEHAPDHADDKGRRQGVEQQAAQQDAGADEKGLERSPTAPPDASTNHPSALA
jgi:hypothetical protein